jgi:hypothetical protein
MNKYILYLSATVLDGIIYSGYTSLILKNNASNSKMLILTIEAFVSILIFFYVNKVGKQLNRVYAIIGMVGSIFSYATMTYSTDIQLINYGFLTFSTSMFTLDLSKKIIENSKSIQNGFSSIANLRSIATMIGFFLGSVLAINNFREITLLSFVLFLIFFIFIKNDFPMEKSTEFKFSIKKIKSKKILIILGLLSSNTVIWIPIVVANVLKKNVSISFLPFVLPGVSTLIFIGIHRKFQLKQKIIYLSFFVVSVLLITSIQISNISLQILFLTLIVPLSLLVSIKLRSDFLIENEFINKKTLLQLLSVNGNIFLLFFSILSLYIVKIESLILIFNIVTFIYLYYLEVSDGNRNRI